MAIQHQSPAHFAFGPFQFNAAAGELRKHGVRVPISGQPLQILLILIESSGELVTRERLRDQVWSEGTFVDFEHGLNGAINKLRRALGDSADSPRYIETVAGRGYRFTGTLEPPPELPKGGAPSAEEQPLKSRLGHVWWIAVGAVCLAAGVAVGWRLHDPADKLPPWRLTPLTADEGVSDSPALSRDGKLLAYSSDRGTEGERDLYVKHVGGGEPVRLTFDGTGNTMPDFSPDGSRIVFRSNRDGGGIYEIPAFGGDARLLVHGGRRPRYSPDGSKVSYWVGVPSISALVPGSGVAWVIPTAGGNPERLAPNLTTARDPLWSPDGKHVLVVGYAAEKAFDSSGVDWWLAPTNGAEAIRTGAYDALVKIGLQPNPEAMTSDTGIRPPNCWSASDGKVTFAVTIGALRNLWEIGLSPKTGKVTGAPARLTTSPGVQIDPACAPGGDLVFTNIESSADGWLLPFDLNRGLPTGAPERITQGPAVHNNLWIAGNGGLVAFSSNQSGPMNIWQRDLKTGKEKNLAASPLAQRFPVSNAAGSKIAFSVFEKDKRAVYLSAPGEAPEKLCEGCLRATDWSRDEKALLTFGGDPYQVNLLDLASHRQTPLVKHKNYHLLYARFSPDNRWVSFTARAGAARAHVFIAPADGPRPVPESEWIAIADVAPDEYANWSPDGKTLYFTSVRDGHSCLWGQRIDASSHKPVGEPFAAHHLHGRRTFVNGGWSSGAGFIALSLVDTTGNIWMMSRATSSAR